MTKSFDVFLSHNSKCLNQFVRRRLPVIPVLLPGAPGEPELPFFLDGFTWVDLRGGLTEEGLDRLEWGIRGRKPERPKSPKTSGSAPEAKTTTSTLGRSVADFLFNFNGINGATGEPLYPSASLGEMDALARSIRLGPQQTAEAIYRRDRRNNLLGGIREGFNPRDLASSGWGVIFPRHADPEIREALAPLIEHRSRWTRRSW